VSSTTWPGGHQPSHVGPRRADDSWELFNRSASGSLQPDPRKFPAGVRPLRDWLHARNMTLGLYTSDAERSCKPTAGSLYHETADAATLALDFGIDFIKVDNVCSIPQHLASQPSGLSMCHGAAD
jgi:hypothetical protein